MVLIGSIFQPVPAGIYPFLGSFIIFHNLAAVANDFLDIGRAHWASLGEEELEVLEEIASDFGIAINACIHDLRHRECNVGDIKLDVEDGGEKSKRLGSKQREQKGHMMRARGHICRTGR